MVQPPAVPLLARSGSAADESSDWRRRPERPSPRPQEGAEPNPHRSRDQASVILDCEPGKPRGEGSSGDPPPGRGGSQQRDAEEQEPERQEEGAG